MKLGRRCEPGCRRSAGSFSHHMRFISASNGFSAVMQASVMPVRGRSGPAHPWCFPLCGQGALGVSNASTGAARGGALGVHLNNWALHTPIAPRDLRYGIKGHDTYPDPGGGQWIPQHRHFHHHDQPDRQPRRPHPHVHVKRRRTSSNQRLDNIGSERVIGTVSPSSPLLVNYPG